jgi:outer membrane protein assembly factor BamE (lipoprotein component of BamABCDE complex)
MKLMPAKIFFTVALVGMFLGGCESIVTQHGNILDANSLARIEPGKTRLIEVEALFGKPSATGAFNSGTVYYVSQIMEEKPGGKKTPVKRTVVAFTHDSSGVITDMTITDSTTGQTVFHRNEKTPTPGDTFGVLEQIFRNVSRPRVDN